MNPMEPLKKNNSHLAKLPVPTLSAYSAFSVFIITRLEKLMVFIEEKEGRHTQVESYLA